MTEPILNGHSANGYAIPEFEEVKVPVPWGYICGKWWGPRNVQPILGIHGWQDNCGTFDNLAPLLIKKGFSFFCIDLPGHGFSSHIPQGLQYHLWTDGVYFVRRIVKYFDWEKIAIIGHSLGGGIAFLYASIYPDDVSKYVSLDISSPCVRNTQKLIAASGPSIDKMFNYEKKSLDDMPCYEYDDMLGIMMNAHVNSVEREGCEILLKRGMIKADHKEGCYLFTRDPRLKLAALGFVSMDQVMEFASRITCEVLNIQAEDGIRLYPQEQYDLPLDAIEHSARRLERVKVEGTHHVHLNNAKIVEPFISSFLIDK